MNRARINTRVFLLEGINSLGTAYYYNYLFFYLRNEFGFSSLQNLLVCALNGFVYIFAAYWAGQYGQKHGYLKALRIGCAIMSGALAASCFANGPAAILVLLVVWTVGVCLTWPNLEALAADRVSSAALPGVLGTYNVVWAGGSAVTYFAGGAMALTLGWRSIFWLPIVCHAVQYALALRLEPAWSRMIAERPAGQGEALHEAHPRGAMFLRLAWIANPFAYIAISAIIPLIPDLAARLHLTAAAAGVFCSIWFFARMFTFVLLAWWPGWHYRTSHLFISYAGMLLCFAGMLLLENLWWIVAVQIGFGWCIGVIYYSSLYYSMHVGDTKGEHGGIHEAAIGLGIFGGPAVGAAAVLLAPAYKHSSVAGVALVLGIGLAIMGAVRRRA